MYECMQAEARVLILDRTPWHMTWEACDLSAPVVRSAGASAGARVSERVAGGAIPDFFEDEPSATVASRAFAGAAPRAASRRHCP